MSDTYNGWTNYATWRINLEIFSDIPLEDYFGHKPDLHTLTTWCREFAEELLDESCPNGGLALDYANAFLREADWNEIATHMLDAADFGESK